MLLIIPTIPIQHDNCDALITARHQENSEQIYSANPVERARLLRKENAKALHIEFRDCQAWEGHSVEVVRHLREAVDIPIEVTLGMLPADASQLEPIFHAGANRLFLPVGSSLQAILDLFERFGRKIVPMFTLASASESLLAQLKSNKLDRIAIELNAPDEVSNRGIDWAHLLHITHAAQSHGIRITALHGVRGYPDLDRIHRIGGALDSLVLCRALNENRFPCQMIWRELEEECALQPHRDPNLWANPLDGVPHI